MKRLLIVEDDELYTELLKRLLEPSFEIELSHTLGSAKHKAGAFDALIVDVGLPDAPREKVVEEMKAAAPNVAIVVLSSYSDPNYIRDAISKSASAYLIKGKDDVDPEMLASHIRLAMVSNASCLKLDRVNDELSKL